MELFSGTWKSTKYTQAFSRGNVWISLYPADHKETYVTEGKIKYLGMYRLSQEESMFITVKPDSQKAESKDFETPEIKVAKQLAPSGKGDMSFQIKKRAGDTIEGEYRLSYPEDHGTFKLKKGPNNIEQCAVM